MQIERLWAGTEASLNDYIERLSRLDAGALAQIDARRAACEDEEDDDGELRPRSRLSHKAGTSGVVSIRGGLTSNDDPWLNDWLGLTGYGEIRNAVLELANDPGVTSILLDIDSGGGSVTGMSDTAKLLRTVDAQIKPVFAHTGGNMCSAAYYLGCSARAVSASDMAEVGSIGVLIVHRTAARALKENGIDVTVIRSGEFKALANPYEELSEEGKSDLQARSDYTYDLFQEHVADRRGVTKSYVKSHMAEGRVFIGQQALDVGLIDAVQSVDAAVMHATVAKTGNYLQHGASALKQEEQDMAHKLTPMYAAAREAALQASAERKALSGAESVVETRDGTQEDTKPEDTKAEAAKPEDTKPEDTKVEASREEELQTQLVDAQAQVKVLAEQVRSLNAQLLEQGVQMASAKAAHEASAPTHAALRAIACAAVDHLNIALKHAGGQASALTDEQIVAEHTRLSAEFDANFKAGGVAVVSSKGVDADKADPLKAARRNAARLG